MTRQTSFKSHVRSRMDKTGERCTTARRRVLEKPTPARSVRAAGEQIKSQRVSDASVRARTGRGWDEWFALLDSRRASERRHADIARRLLTEHHVDSWSAQSITVGYEQARGMRAPGQSSDGYFSASCAKTIAVPVNRLFEAFSDPVLRARWLPSSLEVRTATAPKSLRADWPDGSTRIVVGFTPKGDAKAQVAVLHDRLADAETMATLKAFWRERLTALKSLLEG